MRYSAISEPSSKPPAGTSSGGSISAKELSRLLSGKRKRSSQQPGRISSRSKSEMSPISFLAAKPTAKKATTTTTIFASIAGSVMRSGKRYRERCSREPDVADATSWVSRFSRDEGKNIKLLTHHYYREGQNPTSSIEKLLHPDPKLDPMLAQLSAATKSSGVPYRICETNSFSGGGKPGVSDTLASALWVLDFMFALASAGCAGVNMETGVNHRGFISSYSPIGDDEQAHYWAAPEYYGMLAFAQAGAGRMIGSSIDAGDRNVRAYATQPARDRLVLTLINKEQSYHAGIAIEAGTSTAFRRGWL